MDYFTTAVAIVAGLCFAFGGIYLFVGVRRNADRTRNILFALFSLAYGGAILTARASFMAESVDEYASANRVSTLIAAIGFTLLVWFVAAYTSTRPRILLGVITAAFTTVGLAALFAPDLVVNTSGGIGKNEDSASASRNRAVTACWCEAQLITQSYMRRIRLGLESSGVVSRLILVNAVPAGNRCA